MPLTRALGAALIVAGFMLIDLPAVQRAIADSPEDFISAYEARLQPVRRDTPEDAELGFIADGDLVAKYYLAEYALVPRLIERGTSERQILGVFDGPADGFLSQQRLRVLKNYGHGVLLLEKQP